MAKDNKILQIQDYLMREMQRLDDDKYMKTEAKNEVARSNALSQTANTFIKSINLGLRVMEVASKNEQTKQSLSKELGVE